MTAIIDYGVGNLFSLKSSFAVIGENAVVTNDPETIDKADRIILPGVGAFGDAAKKLFDSGMADVLLQQAAKGKPILGICLGMQLLFEKSYEYGEHKGLGLIKGSVKPMSDILSKEYKIPQIGWNALRFVGERSPLFKYINEGDFVYFVHSYYGADCGESLIADVEYGFDVTAAVADKNVFGTQFHPEKSGEVGLKILKAFCELN
ncbi:MAG: imidazole glycerol phosphate synthase subunit HisH [Clostridia bacterium]|nr:imidazole glycerol phosphate synthase subunit HisH [Clostridia bacterium]MBQ2152648.1 imidazole glycerol phosphate synthase subunit HisH [Clostridia bacterium]MBQ2347836.1 imidazole glycerol phosphate synthase subunit HisH [Clostridia bacterium]MBQ5439420.1 imidazole glycerol phosphate synthase subunit HisH [Clostridia bacterium]